MSSITRRAASRGDAAWAIGRPTTRVVRATRDGVTRCRGPALIAHIVRGETDARGHDEEIPVGNPAQFVGLVGGGRNHAGAARCRRIAHAARNQVTHPKTVSHRLQGGLVQAGQHRDGQDAEG